MMEMVRHYAATFRAVAVASAMLWAGGAAYADGATAADKVCISHEKLTWSAYLMREDGQSQADMEKILTDGHPEVSEMGWSMSYLFYGMPARIFGEYKDKDWTWIAAHENVVCYRMVAKYMKDHK